MKVFLLLHVTKIFCHAQDLDIPKSDEITAISRLGWPETFRPSGDTSI